MEYSSLKRAKAPHAVASRPAPPRPLSPAEQAAVAENRAFVMAHMPELADLVKAAYREGMIDGWRAVGNCRLLKKEPP